MRSYDAREFGAEDEGRDDVPSVVLVQALGVDEIDMVNGGVGDADLHGTRRVRFREGGICGLQVLKILGEVSWNIGW